LKTHVVKKGENLSKIAKNYGIPDWEPLYEAYENKDFRKLRPDPTKIEPGDKVVIPDGVVKALTSSYKKDLPRMSISIDGKNSSIFVQQKWEYTYANQSGTSTWTKKERSSFHKAVDRVIWNKWSGKYTVTVSGTSDFAIAFKKTVFNVNFDIKLVTSRGHWKVNVTKIPRGTRKTSSVNWNDQTIELDTEDINTVTRQEGGKNYEQVPAAHEFGHAAGNSKHGPAGHGDEYPASSPYKDEKKSMMNIGSQLKKRHADHLILMLNKMIPSATFAIKGIK
jgi:hypothetical protein